MSEESSIEIKLNEVMKTAMKAKDKPTLQTVRMVKAAMQEHLNQPGAPTAADDNLWQTIIASYCKRMGKAAEEFRKAGEQGAAKLAELEFEIGFLKPYLPAMLEGDKLTQIVQAAVNSTGAQTAKDIGRVMGTIMKDYKGKVDSKKVKDMISGLLSS